MNVHVSIHRKKCYNKIRTISHFRPFIDEQCTTKLVISLVLSKMNYCNCIMYGMTREKFYKIQLIQNDASRIVKKASKLSSASD